MNKPYGPLYHEMMITIQQCQQVELSTVAENCFWIACNYWNLLKESMDDAMFTEEATQIFFFKNIKPAFTSQIQYFTILCEVLPFVPHNTTLQTIFWELELKRYERFCEKNKEFIANYKNGYAQDDHINFVKVKEEWVPRTRPVAYDADLKYCSSHDHLVRGYLANTMYFEFVTAKLKKESVENYL